MALPELGEGAADQDGYLVTWQAPKPKTTEQIQEEITKELEKNGIELERVDPNKNGYPRDRNMI